MSANPIRLWGQKTLGYVPHTTVSGDAWQHINYGTATSNGAADGSTIIDTGNPSGGADTYNGRYWVRMLTGSAIGQMKRVVDDDGSGTLTFEAGDSGGFSAQIASGDRYEVLLSPEPVIVVDSSSGATNIVDAVRTEADVDDADFWAGYWILPITGNEAGEKAQISAFVPGTGTFTVGSGFGGALAAGDVCLLRKFAEVDLGYPPITQAYYPRLQNRNNLSMGDGIVGERGGAVSFSAWLVASGTHAASGSAANESVLNGLMEASGLEESVGTSVTVEAGSTTTSINISTGSWEDLAIGQMVIDAGGNASFITALTDGGAGDDVVTVSPPLPVAPAAASTLYGTRMYKKSTDGDTCGVCLDFVVDGVRTVMTGCKGNVTLSGENVQVLLFEFSVDHWTREQEPFQANVNTAFTSVAPVKAEERIFWLDTTKFNIGGFSATPGAVASPRNVQGSKGVNGRAGFQLTDYAASMTFRELSEVNAELVAANRFLNRTAVAAACVMGSAANTVAVRIPVGRVNALPNAEESEGMMAFPSVVEAQDAGLTTDGGGTSVKIPDFAIHMA